MGCDKVSSRLGSSNFCIARMRTVSHPAELAPLHNQSVVECLLQNSAVS